MGSSVGWQFGSKEKDLRVRVSITAFRELFIAGVSVQVLCNVSDYEDGNVKALNVDVPYYPMYRSPIRYRSPNRWRPE